MPYSIQDKTILITGANRGIGKTMVEVFLKHGAKKIYAAVRDTSKAQPLIDQHGDKVVAIEADLNKPDTIKQAAKTATDVDIVVNNAGILTNTSPLGDTTFDNLQKEFDTNVLGFLHVAREFAPVLRANGGGVLAQLNSVVSMKSFPQFSTYSASKAMSYSFTQALKEALSGNNTRVVSIHPGPIATDMGKDAGLEDVAEPPELVAEAFIKALENDEFHVFPDTMAKQIGEAYAGFAKNIVEADLMEG